MNLLLNVTPVNAAEAWADFERSDFGTVPTLRLRPLEFEPDLVRRDLYNLQIENVTDPALHTLFRAKRDEIARQITALEDRDTSRFVYGSLQLYGAIAELSDALSPLEIGDEQRGIIEAMSKKLVADGMYFVGIDVIGDKVVEINAESPGGMQSVERLCEMDVCPTVIEALERRACS